MDSGAAEGEVEGEGVMLRDLWRWLFTPTGYVIPDPGMDVTIACHEDSASGFVLDRAGRPVAGVSIYNYRGGQEREAKATNEHGAWQLYSYRHGDLIEFRNGATTVRVRSYPWTFAHDIATGAMPVDVFKR